MSKTIEMQARKGLMAWYNQGRTAEQFQRTVFRCWREAKTERARDILIAMDTLSRS